ncbi:MAG: M60 family metallopeptidase [Kiritimatiellae bacterium]|nr:M60 family metallopeptidase [Kiritimatiellia bacterium]
MAITAHLTAAETVRLDNPAPPPAADGLRSRTSAAARHLKVSGGSVPGSVLAAFRNAVPLAYGHADGNVCSVAAAAEAGRGRVVAFGHGSLVSTADNAAFVRECVSWLAKGGKVRRIYVDGSVPFRPADGVETVLVKGYGELESLPADAVFATAPDSHPLKDAPLLSAFARRGGGVLSTVIGWGWKQVSGGKSVSSENAFNAAMGEFGLFASDAVVWPARDGVYPVIGAEGLPGTVGEEVLDAVLRKKDGVPAELFSRYVRLLDELFASMPESDTRLMPRLMELADGSSAKAAPSPSCPLSSDSLAERLGLALHARRWHADPVREWPAHPAAATYPGLPSAPSPRVVRTVEVDLSVPRWHGTGLFAAAGEAISVAIPESAAGTGLKVRVGTTTCCNTRHDKWLRAPDVSEEVPLRRAATRFSSPFGGMVYVVVPPGLAGRGKISVEIGGACPAAWFVEGRDTPETWRKALAESPAPVAEIESDAIALTVPADVARAAGDPSGVLALWRRILELDAELSGRKAPRTSPERMCFDVQLCCGYMHSGYPIMLPSHSIRHLLNADTIRRGDVDDVWGFFHEMGHNHQNYDWTFDGTGEVTVNFFSLYNMEKICGKKPRETAKMGNARLRERVAKWKAAGRPFDEWKRDPFLALDFFVELQAKYGWDAFRKFFAEYVSLPQSERPKTDLDKRRQWCERFSRIVGEDLSEEFSFMLR